MKFLQDLGSNEDWRSEAYGLVCKQLKLEI